MTKKGELKKIHLVTRLIIRQSEGKRSLSPVSQTPLVHMHRDEFRMRAPAVKTRGTEFKPPAPKFL